MRSAVSTCRRAASPLRSSRRCKSHPTAPPSAKLKAIEAASRCHRTACLRCSSLRRAIIFPFNPGGAVCSSKLWRSFFSHSSIGSNSTHVLLQIISSLGPQQLQSPLQIALHRGHRGLECSCNLLRRQVLLVSKNQHRSLRLRQRPEQFFQPRAQRRSAFFRLNAVTLLNLHPLVHPPYLAPPQRIRRAAHF